MLDRGLVRIGTNPMGRPAAFFTEAGMEGLRQLLRDGRAMDSERYDYLRRELGVEDGLLEIEGVTLPMTVALGQAEVKTVEDLAGLVPDDLRGWFETKNGERVRQPGSLESFNLSADDAEALIMRARVAMGWIEPEPEPEPEPEAEPELEAEAASVEEVEQDA